MTLRCRELLHFSDIAPPLLRGHLPRLNHLDCEGEPQDLATYLSAPSPQPLAAWHLASASPKELLALQHEQGLWPVMTPYKSFSTSPQSAW
jgi:hypothetical protein